MAKTTLSARLMRAAKRHKLRAVDIANGTGATRATVYNWLSGKGVSPAYRASVVQFLLKTNSRA